MDQLRQDLRFALRQLVRNPLFTLVAVVALALGIGANTAVFSVIDAVVLRPLKYPDSDRLVMVWENNASEGLEHHQVSPVTFADLRQMKQIFSNLAGWWHPDINLLDRFGDPIRVKTIGVTGNFFDVMGIPPQIGRGFEEGEDKAGAPGVVVIGDGLWKTRYGGDLEILQHTVTLDGRPYQVVGVMPPGFGFPGETAVWRPLGWNPAQHSRGARFFEAIGRLAPNVEVAQAQAELDALTRRWNVEFPGTNRGWGLEVIALHDETVGEVRPALILMLTAVGFVLLIACANVANLLLSRSASRQKEVAVRSAIGAGRARLMRQFLTESLLLASMGAVLGIFLAFLGLRLLVGFTPIDIPRLEQVAMDWRILGFTSLVALVTGILFGLAPGLHWVKADLAGALKEGVRGTSTSSGGSLRSLLVVGEVALAMTLLVGAGLLIRSFLHLLGEDPGFRSERVLTVNVNLPSSSYRDWNRVSAFLDQALSGLNQHPRIESAAATGFLPLDAGWRVSFSLPKQPLADPNDAPKAQLVTISPGYFKTMGVPLDGGRFFEEGDDAQARPVILINQTLAKRFWPTQDAVGEAIHVGANGIGPLGRSLLTSQDYEVIGVVGDVKNNSLQSQVEPAFFVSHKQFPYRYINLVIRGRGGVTELSKIVREEVRRVDATLPLTGIRRMDDILAESVAQPRFFSVLLTGFAGLAMLLAALGIYGTLSYQVSQSRHELGVRLALGARPKEVFVLVLARGFRLTLVGVLLGAVFSLGLAWSMSRLLYGIAVFDPLTFLGVPLVIVAAAFAACALPARRAGSVDPLLALRTE